MTSAGDFPQPARLGNLTLSRNDEEPQTWKARSALPQSGIPRCVRNDAARGKFSATLVPGRGSLLVGQLGLQLLKLLLQFGSLIGIEIAADRCGPLSERAFPLLFSLALLTQLKINVAQVLVDGGIARDQ